MSNRNLAELVRAIYPEPHTLHLPDGVHGDEDPAGVTLAEFLVVPHARQPRLAIPVRSRAERVAAVRHLAAPRSLKVRLRQAAVRAAVAAPGAARFAFRDRIRISGVAGLDSLQTYLSGALGSDVSLSLHVGGGLRANRKPVVEVFDTDGTTIGFAKVGTNELTRELIQAETAALRRLGAAGLRYSTIPDVRHAGVWRDCEVLVQSSLPVWSKPGTLAGGALAQAMREVSHAVGSSYGPLRRSGYHNQLTRRLDDMADATEVVNPRVREDLRRAGADVLAKAAGTQLEFGAWHGDWSPWNMHAAGSTVYVWDWERFGTGVPVGFDALHHSMHGALGRGMSAERAADQLFAAAPDLLTGFGVSADAAAVTTALYLVDVSTRYLADRQDEAGQALGAVGEWMLPVLGRHSHRLS